jgi:quercetin dioxygenase-like cupin family protein
MANRYPAGFVFAVAVLVAVGVLVQLTIISASAQHGAGANVKVTGKVTDKLLKHFAGSAARVGGLRAIELRRMTMAPGTMMVGEMASDDHADLCIVEQGSVTYVMADGSKRVYKEGDIFIKPLGNKVRSITADPTLGYQELAWTLQVKTRH